MRKIKNPKIDEYVLITKYSDHDPCDPWALGFFSRKDEWKGKTVRYEQRKQCIITKCFL